MKYSPSNAENVFVCHSTVGQEVGHQGRYQQKHDGKVDNCESNGPSFRKCVVFTVAKKREEVVGDGRKCRSYRELMAKKKKKRTDELMR
jgi:hypothetical protein